MNAVLTGRTDIDGVPFRVSILPATNKNRPGTTQGRKLRGGTYEKSTGHTTGNTAAGANAEMHRQFLHGGGGSKGVSFHLTVDDHEIVQLLPLDYVAWPAGDGTNGPGNNTSIATEVCVNRDGNWERTLDNLVKLQAFLLNYGGLGIADMVQHNHWSGKNCPEPLRANGGVGWSSVVKGVVARLAAYSIPPPTPTPEHRYFPETGQYLSHGFLEFWQAEPQALQYFGFPVTGEIEEMLGDGQVHVVQYLQRARLEWHPDAPPGESVQLGLVGVELLAHKP